MEELNYEILRRIQAKERGPALAEIPENFYELAARLLARHRVEQNFREYENVLKIVKYIYSRRQEKIVNAAVNSQRGVESPSEMTARENVLYGSILEMLKAGENNFMQTLSVAGDVVPKDEPEMAGKEKLIEAVTTSAATAATTVAEKPERKLFIRKDVPEFVGLNGKTYGPFKSGDVVGVPPEEADVLIKMKAAEWKE